MKIVTVNASISYNVLIEKGLLTNSGKYIKDVLGDATLCIVTDDTVDALYSSELEASLKAEGLAFIKFVIPHGENSKNAENLISLLELMAASHLTRSDAIIALGGGVVGDLAGFAASVYLRGIRFVQIPTTLLAMVDSSVGGKTAIDLRAGKNLAGAFHQPSLVLCDPNALNTLTSEFFADGSAEVIKYGIINDRELFDLLKLGIKENVEEIIKRCVANKAKIVELDEFDNGARQLLNLGHTSGHAIELCSEFSVSHGSAVAIGMVIAAKIAHSLGLCSKSEINEIISLISAQGLPINSPYDALSLAKAATADKKRLGDSISFVIPYGIGNCRLMKIKVSELEEFIAKGI